MKKVIVEQCRVLGEKLIYSAFNSRNMVKKILPKPLRIHPEGNIFEMRKPSREKEKK